jgi:hypothetical protein
VYEIDTMGLGASSTTTGIGVVFKLNGTGQAMDAQGGAAFTFTAYKPYTASNPPPVPCPDDPCNTWENMTFYLPNGSLDWGGNGERSLDGSIYAPNGTVKLHGEGSTALVQGQVIGQRVVLSGNGPVISYATRSGRGTFGPVLVNTPNTGG